MGSGHRHHHHSTDLPARTLDQETYAEMLLAALARRDRPQEDALSTWRARAKR
jgi:hypothetical protein